MPGCVDVVCVLYEAYCMNTEVSLPYSDTTYEPAEGCRQRLRASFATCVGFLASFLPAEFWFHD